MLKHRLILFLDQVQSNAVNYAALARWSNQQWQVLSCDSLIEIVFKCMDYCAGAAKVWEGCGQLASANTSSHR